ncbi:TRAP transporter large permease [Corticibacterium sp. UT-5YL-CI-8]|nr:TRAP transporter large permease [Tianweitania sp. UT-5YL-CI-8]
MSNLGIGATCVAVMIVLIAVRVHIGLAMAVVAIAGIALIASPNAAFSVLQMVPYEFAANWEFSAVPMFILMGAIAFRAGMTSELFNAGRLWLGRLPGGLAIATNVGSAGFAAAAGTSLAASIAMGRIAIPEMLKAKYDRGLATGVVAAAGTLGVMIPPSIPMIIYGYFAEVSVAKMFMAGILPGLLTAFAFGLMIVIRCIRNPNLAPRIADDIDPAEKWRALARTWPLPVIIVVVIGSIYTGLASPTESAAVGAAAALVIAILQRRMTWPIFKSALLETIESSASLFFIIIGAILLTRLMAFSDLPEFTSNMVIGWGLSREMLVIGTAFIFLLLGCILDPVGLMLLALPVFLPIFIAADIDLIWFGILFIKYIEIGLITPPIGMNIFALKSITPDIPIGVIFRGTAWFFVMEIVVLILMIAFPQITLWLPSMMG